MNNVLKRSCMNKVWSWLFYFIYDCNETKVHARFGLDRSGIGGQRWSGGVRKPQLRLYKIWITIFSIRTWRGEAREGGEGGGEEGRRGRGEEGGRGEEEGRRGGEGMGEEDQTIIINLYTQTTQVDCQDRKYTD